MRRLLSEHRHGHWQKPPLVSRNVPRKCISAWDLRLGVLAALSPISCLFTTYSEARVLATSSQDGLSVPT